MEIPSKHYFIALGFLKYIENNLASRVKIVKGNPQDPNTFTKLDIEGLDTITSHDHVKLLEDLFKTIRDE